MWLENSQCFFYVILFYKYVFDPSHVLLEILKVVLEGALIAVLKE